MGNIVHIRQRFVEGVLSGKLKLTVRETRMCEPGAVMSLVKGDRFHPEHFRDVQCIEITGITITRDGVSFSTPTTLSSDKSEFARLDGFADFDSLLKYYKIDTRDRENGPRFAHRH